MEMEASDILRKDVISIAEGERIGSIARVFVHRTTKMIVGFGVDAGSSWREPDRAYHIDAEQIVTLGRDVLIIPNQAVLGGKAMNESFGELDELASVVHRRILTEDGHDLGHVERINIQTDGLKLTNIAVAGGNGRSPRNLTMDQVLTLGSDVMIVSNEQKHDRDASSTPDRRFEVLQQNPGSIQREDIPMNHDHLTGMAVVSIADGEKLGAVTGVYLDLEQRKIALLDVGQMGGLLATTQTQWTLDADHIHAIGPDAITVDDRSALRERMGTDQTNLTAISALKGRKVVTEGGTLVGSVASVEFDEHSRTLTGLEASPGFFKSNRMVAIDQVINLGHEIVVVSDEVCADIDPALEIAQEEQQEPARREYQMVVGDIEEPARSRTPSNA